MNIDISDMLLFVNKLSELDLPENTPVCCSQFTELQEDVVIHFGKVFDSDVKVEKVRGV